MPATHHKASLPQSGLGGDIVTDAQKNVDKRRIVRLPPNNSHPCQTPQQPVARKRTAAHTHTHPFLPHPAVRPRCPSAVAPGCQKQRGSLNFILKCHLRITSNSWDAVPTVFQVALVLCPGRVPTMVISDLEGLSSAEQWTSQ